MAVRTSGKLMIRIITNTIETSISGLGPLLYIYIKDEGYPSNKKDVITYLNYDSYPNGDFSYN